nr:tRNA-dihydrouridine synthase family protein [uncultured Mediterraneibacter sp.]
MKLYFAPLEGITGWIFRNALHQCFGGFDKYFVPFIRPNQMGHLSAREKKDILPQNNEGMYTVPQILTNRPEDFIRTTEKLKEFGYNEINLNLGCPSKTVVTKGRGSGFLAYPERLDAFLDEIFSKCDIRISLKTRIGIEDPEEFGRILDIYNKYPVAELIIHPRLQKDFYKNTPNMELFADVYHRSRSPVCYNGDIFTPEAYEAFAGLYPDVECVMLGRGVLTNPALARQIRGGSGIRKEELKRFHELLYQSYCREMSGDRTILYKMKELWAYLAPVFTDYKKYAKKIRKSERCAVYEDIVKELFENEEISIT